MADIAAAVGVDERTMWRYLPNRAGNRVRDSFSVEHLRQAGTGHNRAMAERPAPATHQRGPSNKGLGEVETVTLFSIGIHTPAQGVALADLIKVWRLADNLGYSWISTSDHFPGSVGGSWQSNEGVAAQAAIVASTRRARSGVLVYSAGFRHPAVLATSVATIDQLSGGRASLGLGCGSLEKDYEIWGFPYPPLKTRMDIFEESAHCISALLRGETLNFEGNHFRLSGAKLGTAPVKAKIPLHIGTTGEKRGLRIAAKYADVWDSSFLSLEAFEYLRSVLDRHCEDVGRDASKIKSTVNLVLAIGTDPDNIPPRRRAYADSLLIGSVDQVVTRIRSYADAGVDHVNLFLTPPWDFDGIIAIAKALDLPAE
jgi:alkanesulfonate monooxygenase SsuD/methylene tetrahydromethanopterin reductase-like flavin-dependent oxidoreductase (luciferase family)